MTTAGEIMKTIILRGLLFVFVFLMGSFIQVFSTWAKLKSESKTKSLSTQSTQNKKVVIKDWLIVPVYYATNHILLDPKW
jgi:hypothetical protein